MCYSWFRWKLTKDFGESFFGTKAWPIALYYSPFGLSKLFLKGGPAWIALVALNSQCIVARGFDTYKDVENYVAQGLKPLGCYVDGNEYSNCLVATHYGSGFKTTIAYVLPVPSLR